jgi:hypothetical protein
MRRVRRRVTWPGTLSVVAVALALFSGWQKAGDDLAWPFFLGAIVVGLVGEAVRRVQTREPDGPQAQGPAAVGPDETPPR